MLISYQCTTNYIIIGHGTWSNLPNSLPRKDNPTVNPNPLFSSTESLTTIPTWALNCLLHAVASIHIYEASKEVTPLWSRSLSIVWSHDHRGSFTPAKRLTICRPFRCLTYHYFHQSLKPHYLRQPAPTTHAMDIAPQGTSCGRDYVHRTKVMLMS